MAIAVGDLAARLGPAAALGMRGDAAVQISSVTHDSRRVVPGTLFCCVPGGSHDGHDFAATAVASGAAAVLVERWLPVDAPQLLVDDVRLRMGVIAAAVYGDPAAKLTMIGITGTNGKTTVASLIAAVLGHAGRHVGVIGTLTGRYTTPEAPDLHAMLAAFVADGTDTVVMEVSSHALSLHRVEGCVFDVAVFTNLGRDHLDLHGTIERYFAAKAQLFTPAMARRAVINVDDAHGTLLAQRTTIPVAASSASDATDVEVDADALRYRWHGVEIRLAFGGAFNVSNSLLAAETCSLLGLTDEQIADGLASAAVVPGRFEPVRAGQPFQVVVDFAHTPDGLDAALSAARAAARDGRLIVVFGAGGDRDRTKRPLMAEAVSRWADAMVVTSDNPRSEQPEAIIEDILRGVPGGYRGAVVVQPDRRTAFAEAFAMAHPADLVVIAGKGHEATQTVGDKVFEFDDRAVARGVLAATEDGR